MKRRPNWRPSSYPVAYWVCILGGGGERKKRAVIFVIYLPPTIPNDMIGEANSYPVEYVGNKHL
jgi:hypothetical protein